MKKILKALLVLLLIFNISIPVYAAKEEIDVPNDTDFSIDVPDGWHTIKRGVTDDNPLLETLGTTAAVLNKNYENGNIYLNLIKDDFSKEISIISYENESDAQLGNYKDETDEALQKYMTDFLESDEIDAKPQTYTDSSLYSNDISKFMVYNYEQPTFYGAVYSKEYSTVINDMHFKVILHSYKSTQIDEETDNIMKQIIDSIKFTKLGVTTEKIIIASVIGVTIILFIAGIISLIKTTIKSKKQKKEQDTIEDTDLSDIGI